VASLAALALVLPVIAPPGAASDPPLPALTDRQLAGQRVIHAFAGTSPSPALEALIRRGEAAGVILFGPNVTRGTAGVRALVRRLQAIPRPPGLRAPLLVMVDQEGGLVRRLPGPPVASAEQLGRSGPEAAGAAGRAAGRSLRSVGVNVDLAPVADVARAGSAIGAQRRSFGSAPGPVASAAAAFARGLQAEGVAATAKHFPGLGRALGNTDLTPVRIPASLDQLRRVDERPFARAVGEGVRLVMVGSAVYPALDERPAVLSRRVIRGELRGRLGFDGVVVTDALDTPSLADAGGDGEAAVLAAAAGADLVLFSGPAGGPAAVDAIAAALRDGRLARGPARAAAARVLALRASAGEPGR
jgi:beta-N-acetylhexosaminidase